MRRYFEACGRISCRADALRGRFRRAGGFAVVGLFVMVAVPVPALAQLSAERRQSLAATLEQAGDNLDPARLPNAEEIAEDVRRDYQHLVEHLRRTAAPENGQGWLEYIAFDALAAAFEEDRPLVEQGRIAREIYWRLTRNQEGLERPAVLQLRESLQRFVAAVLVRDADRVVPAIDRQLDQLAALLREGSGPLTAQEVATINRVLQIVDSSGLAPEVVATVTGAIGWPNARLLVGSALVTEVVNRPINRTAPSDECILGTRVISTAHLNGFVTATLLPARGTASLLLSMNANFSSLGNGYQKSVRVRTRGYGHVTAQRQIAIGADGVSAGPVAASANLDSDILGIYHHLRIVRRIAAKRAQQTQPLANSIAAERLERRVAGEFAEETGGRLSQGNLLPRGEITDVLRRLDIEQPRRRWGSTPRYIAVGMTIAEPRQATTLVAPPPVAAGYGAVVQIQESAVDNTASVALAERTLRDTELAEFAEGLVPGFTLRDPAKAVERLVEAAVEDPEDAEPMSIQFAALRPVIFEARDGQVRVGIRGARFEQGDRVLDQPLEITAVYVPRSREDGAVILERQGPVEVAFPGGRERRLSFGQVALRRNIEERFAEVFPETLLGRIPPMVLPADESAPGATDVSIQLKPAYITAEDGWLTVALK